VWTGLALAAAIALPWFLLMTALHGQSFLQTALGYEVMDRYLSPDFPGPQRGATYFLGAWLGDGAPWSLFAMGAVVWAALAWPRLAPGTRRAVRLGVAWWGTVIVLFSFSSYKLPHYIMPAYPATALLAGVFADAVAAGAARSRWPWRVPAALAAVLLAAGAVLLGLLLRRAFELPWVDPSFGLPLLLAGGGVALVAALVLRRDRIVMPVLLVTLVAAYAWLILIVSPRELRRFQPIPQLARSAAASVPAGAPLVVAGNYGAPGLIYYAHRPVEQLASREDLLTYLSQPGVRAIVLGPGEAALLEGLKNRLCRAAGEEEFSALEDRLEDVKSRVHALAREKLQLPATD
jgi:4-amino-4-deoxy-L-arabinose transferase-like glycosyltransferase